MLPSATTETKCAGIVRRSWLIRIRPEAAATRSTSGSFKPARPASAAVRMSISGAARRKPRRVRPSRSASAWNLTRIANPLKLRNQFSVRLSRLLMLGFGGAMPYGKVCINLSLVPQVKSKRSMHLLERQCRIALDHTLSGQSLAEKIHQGIEGHACASNAIDAFNFRYICPLHGASQSHATRRRQSPQAHPKYTRLPERRDQGGETRLASPDESGCRSTRDLCSCGLRMPASSRHNFWRVI